MYVANCTPWSATGVLALLVSHARVTPRGAELGRGCSSRHGERQRHHLSGEDVVVRVNQLDLHLVLAGRQPGYVYSVVVTCIRPPPGQVVDGYVQMPDTWRPGGRPPRTRVRCARSPLGTGPRRRPGPAPREAGDPRSAWVRALSRSRRTVKRRGCPSLWAKALVVSSVPAETTASILMDMGITVSPCRGPESTGKSRVADQLST